MTKQEQVKILNDKIEEIKSDLNSISKSFIGDYKNKWIFSINDEFYEYAKRKISKDKEILKNFYIKNLKYIDKKMYWEIGRLEDFMADFEDYYYKINKRYNYDLEELTIAMAQFGSLQKNIDDLEKNADEIKACLFLYEVIRVLQEANEGELFNDDEMEELTDCILHEKNFSWVDVEGIEFLEDLNQVIKGLNLRY